MRLKYSGQALICSAVALLALGILTGGIVFYAFLAAAVAVLAIDYFRCRALLRDLVAHLAVSRRVSGEDLAMGTPLDIAYDLNYAGGRSFTLQCIQPADPRESAPAQSREISLTKGTQTVGFRLKPAKYGKYTVPGLRLVAQSLLFQGTVAGGGNYPVNVYVTISGLGAVARGRGSLRSLAISGLEATSHRGGCDFSGIRDYLPGDSIRYIDWARSSKSNLPVVRDFEETRVMPLFLAIDTDASMRAGEPRSELDTAVKFAMRVAQEVLSSYESVGLSCFSREQLTCFLPPGSGKAHRGRLMSTLLSLETGGDTPARPLAMPSLSDAVRARNALAGDSDLQPLLAVMGDAIDSFAANILEDGFLKAINRVSRVGTRCHLVVLTNLSMGLASLLNGIRLAQYRGHRVTVMLLPDIWYGGSDRADPVVLYDQYRRIQDVFSSLRSMNVNVIEVGPGDDPESVSPGYRLRNVIPRM